MQKLNIKKLLLFTIIIIIFLGINIIITLLFFPKFIPVDKSLLSFDFNDNNLTESLSNYKNYLKEYSNDSIDIEKSIGYNNSSALVLNGSDDKSFVHFIIMNKNYNYLKLEMLIREEKIKKTSEKSPYVMLYIEDDKGKKYWDLPHKITNFFTLFKWKNIDDYFYIPDYAYKIHFVINNESISGKIICDNINLTPYSTNSFFKIYRNIIFIILFVLIFGIILIFHKFIFKFIKQIIILIVILIGILGPKRYLYGLAYKFNINGLYIQKFGHFIMFFLLSFFIYLNKKYFDDQNNKNFKYFLIIELISIAVLTEMLQFLTFSRSMSFYDCLIDSAGILLGILSASKIKFKKDNKKILQ